MHGIRSDYDWGHGYDELFASPGVPHAHCAPLVDAIEAVQ